MSSITDPRTAVIWRRNFEKERERVCVRVSESVSRSEREKVTDVRWRLVAPCSSEPRQRGLDDMVLPLHFFPHTLTLSHVLCVCCMHEADVVIRSCAFGGWAFFAFLFSLYYINIPSCLCIFRLENHHHHSACSFRLRPAAVAPSSQSVEGKERRVSS